MLRSRLGRLEKALLPQDGRCPLCASRPDLHHRFTRHDDPPGVIRYLRAYPNVPLAPPIDQDPELAPCPVCGWQPEVIHIVERLVTTREQAEVCRPDAQEGRQGTNGSQDSP